MLTEQPRRGDKAAHATDRNTDRPNPYLVKILGAEKAAKLEKKYFLDLTGKIDFLNQYLEAKDMEGIRKIAHQLKGSGMSYGFEYITAVGIAMSSFAKRSDYPALGGLIHGLHAWVKERS